MEPIWIAVILFVVGAILIAGELFLPGGVLGVVGGLAIIGGIVLCFMHSQTAGAIAVVSVAILGPIVGWAWVTNAHRLPGARSLFLANVGQDSIGTPQYRIVPGQVGVTLGELRPGGMCEFEGERVPAQSEAGIIPAGSRVRVVAFSDGRATVRTV